MMGKPEEDLFLAFELADDDGGMVGNCRTRGQRSPESSNGGSFEFLGRAGELKAL